jgi:hypothetical protein
LLAQTIRACEYFHGRLLEMAARLSERVRISVPFEPDTNLICLLVNPTGNTSLAEMNRFGRSLFENMKVDPSQPLQIKRFIASYTSLLVETLPEVQAQRILDEVGIDPATFQALARGPGPAADHVFVLRHTLMNPWLLAERDGKNYLDRYLEYLEELIDQAL